MGPTLSSWSSDGDEVTPDLVPCVPTVPYGTVLRRTLYLTLPYGYGPVQWPFSVPYLTVRYSIYTFTGYSSMRDTLRPTTVTDRP